MMERNFRLYWLPGTAGLTYRITWGPKGLVILKLLLAVLVLHIVQHCICPWVCSLSLAQKHLIGVRNACIRELQKLIHFWDLL
jgi:hypothetical protein